MTKRIKSFFMTLASLAVPAVVAILATPQWVDLVGDFNNWVISIGVPSSVVVVIGLFLAELWKGWINKIKLDRVEAKGIVTTSAAMELY